MGIEAITVILAIWLAVSLWANIKQHAALVKLLTIVKQIEKEYEQ